MMLKTTRIARWPRVLLSSRYLGFSGRTEQAEEPPAKRLKSDGDKVSQEEIAKIPKPILGNKSTIHEITIQNNAQTCSCIVPQFIAIAAAAVNPSIRNKLPINNSCELVLGGEKGDALFLISRSKNQFFQHREMLLSWFYS